MCIFITQLIIVRAISLEQKEEKKNKGFKKTSMTMKLLFTLRVVYFKEANCKQFLDVVKFRNWPESSEEGKFSCLYQNVPASLENVTIAP